MPTFPHSIDVARSLDAELIGTEIPPSSCDARRTRQSSSPRHRISPINGSKKPVRQSHLSVLTIRAARIMAAPLPLRSPRTTRPWQRSVPTARIPCASECAPQRTIGQHRPGRIAQPTTKDPSLLYKLRQMASPLPRRGQTDKKGDLLIEFDMNAIKAEGYQLHTPVLVTNSDDFVSIKVANVGAVTAGDELLSIV